MKTKNEKSLILAEHWASLTIVSLHVRRHDSLGSGFGWGASEGYRSVAACEIATLDNSQRLKST